ncbi:unnamed protein product, partial [Amoebophrya sp. A120]|eukprot:GSA120T00019182001.1
MTRGRRRTTTRTQSLGRDGRRKKEQARAPGEGKEARNPRRARARPPATVLRWRSRLGPARSARGPCWQAPAAHGRAFLQSMQC